MATVASAQTGAYQLTPFVVDLTRSADQNGISDDPASGSAGNTNRITLHVKGSGGPARSGDFWLEPPPTVTSPDKFHIGPAVFHVRHTLTAFPKVQITGAIINFGGFDQSCAYPATWSAPDFVCSSSTGLFVSSGVLGPIGATHKVSAARWLQAIEINLVGSFHLVQAVLPSMLAAGQGKIIQFSGGGAAYGRPFFTAYSASKAALVRFTESLAAELRDRSIDTNAIAPGPVKSRMWDELRASGAAGGPQALEELEKMDLTGGVSAERAAALALFLASNRSNGLTGRLISAVHDKWEEMAPRISKIASTDAWTLRRVALD